MIKKIYHAVALFALLNVVVIGGGAGYLYSTGDLSAERIEQVAAVLRGEWPQPQEAEAEVVEERAAPTRSAESLDQEQVEEELMRLQADRRRAELQQQAATVAAARLEVTRQREALERRDAEIRAQAKRREKEEESQGFKKELDLLSSVKPKVAVSYLLEKPREDAATLLLQMETRKGKRLVEAAKTASQRRAMAEVLEMLREMSPARAELLSLKRK
jgi:hypothetical protein